MQPRKRKKQAFLNIKNGEIFGLYKKLFFRNSNSFLIYAGSLRLKAKNYNAVPESFAIAGGRVKYDNGSWHTEYYITDHLGSVRAVTDASGNVLATFDYTPYGELLAATDNTATGTDHLFTGKEQQSKLGVSELYDSQARFMGTDGRFTSIDPLAEKYYHLSPYAYCAGDPVNLIDPDGMKLRITGVQQNTTLELLSELFGSELKLEDDFVTITVEPEKYNKKSKLIAEIINNENIIVELWTTDGKFTEDGTPFCGGVFIGNKTKDFKELFKYAKSINVPFTIHAGEADGYESIKAAIDFGASRLGHGIKIIDYPDLINEAKEKGITLEVCPTSNVQTNAVNI